MSLTQLFTNLLTLSYPSLARIPREYSITQQSNSNTGTEDEFSCSISEKRSRNAWGSCVEIFRDFKVIPKTEDEIVTITNEELNTRAGTKRQKPWIVVPNEEVGAIVTLQGILDTTATSMVVIPKLDNRWVIPLYGGDLDCSLDLGYSYRQKRQICVNQGCTFTNVKEGKCAPPSEEEKTRIEVKPIDWRRSRRTSDRVRNYRSTMNSLVRELFY